MKNTSKSKRFYFLPLLAVAAVVAVFGLPRTFATDAWPAAQAELIEAQAGCGAVGERRPELERLHGEIARAESLDQARSLALAPTDAAIGALGNARAVMPFSEELRQAQTRLADVRTRIENANTPRQVADEFSGMLLAGLDQDRAAQVRLGKTECDYSTGEIIAIVLGLILGIIPGLILLVLLC